jgi:hypothetical protein
VEQGGTRALHPPMPAAVMLALIALETLAIVVLLA